MVDGGTVRIAWEVIETGTTGTGEPIDKVSAEAWVRFLDKEYGSTMRHWIVEDKEKVG